MRSRLTDDHDHTGSSRPRCSSALAAAAESRRFPQARCEPGAQPSIATVRQQIQPYRSIIVQENRQPLTTCSARISRR